jgi:inosine/guanosine/xanthosine phosphorylase family protein
LAACGVKAVILTNAAGGINPELRPGDFMCITDHINFMGANPLRGELASPQSWFVDLSRTYDEHLRKLMIRAALEEKVRLSEGVYLAVSGPCYETPAEIRAFARLGADAVGMSTVPEAIVARHCGLRVAGLSCITNPAAGLNSKQITHEEVLAAGEQAKKGATALLSRFLQLFGAEAHGS